MIAPFSISAFCKLWIVNDGHFEPTEHENVGHLYERLDTKAPEDAKPYVAWGEYVDFYKRDGNAIWDRRISFHQLQGGAYPQLLGIIDRTGKEPQLKWWEVASGTVTYHHGQWCMRWLLYKHTRHAKMMNEGWEGYRR